MLRAMDSAVAGLRAHQNKLDVIGNNIANVNTAGFKAQSYSFKDTMYQTSAASSGGARDEEGNGVTGGSNPAQYGYGTLTGSISTDFTSSTPTYVGGFNAAINGTGFFITNASNLKDGVALTQTDSAADTAAIKGNSFSFTRVGQFSVDANGYIVDANRNFVYGFQPTGSLTSPTGYDDQKLIALRAPAQAILNKDSGTGAELSTDPDFTGAAIQLKGIEIGSDGIIRGIVDDGGSGASVVLGKAAIATFQNQEGLTKAGGNTFSASSGDNSGNVTATTPGGATPTLMSGYLEASNVDLAREFSDMITTQRGFQANAKIITVSDEVLQELVNMKR